MPDPAATRAPRGIPGLTDVTACLRATWRADEDEWMNAAAQRWIHGRSISDVIRDYAAHGDRIAIEAAGRVFEGVVTDLGDDRVDLATRGAAVTVRIALGDALQMSSAPIVVRRSVRARAGGRRLPAALATFRARLLELEASGVAVRIGTFVKERELVGSIVVGRDHVVVRGDGEVVVPTCWVAYVVEEDRGEAA
jgi:hypothetical protein